MRFAWSIMVWMAVLAAGCLDPSDVPCGDGRVCPAGYTCSASYCFSAEQIDACNGGDDGTACTTSEGPGVCSERGCIIPVCGNGTMEPSEVCDDGNFEKGDGCSPKCDSNEVCGNGFVDYLQDEQCDDTNLRNNDGCNANCQLEYRVWRPHSPGGIQTSLNVAAAYDSGRKRLVVFGAALTNGNGEGTFELEGASWFKRPLVRSPVARYGARMVYDSKRRRIVLFGGITNDGLDRTTWEYDGTAWYEIATAVQPPGRSYQAMTYDSARGRVVMFGGVAISGVEALGDTWEYDGTAWVETTPASGGPPARGNSALAYDPIRGTAILYGGRDPAQSSAYNDTWRYNGTWSSVAATASTGRSGMSLTFDPTRGVVVMAGGTADETNTFDGTTWTLEDFGGPNRVAHIAAFDEQRQRVVVWGGRESLTTETFKLDELTATGWNNIPTTIATTPWTVYPSVAFDTSRGQLIQFGGYYGFPGSGNPGNDVYAMGENSWTQLTTTGGPPTARYRSAIAYDPVKNVIVAFGGQTDDTTVVGDTWELDGTTWIARTPTMAPSPRAGHRMVYDSLRKKVVLFGGETATTSPVKNNELWEYDTATHAWTQITLAGAPEARADFGMAFDSRRGRAVVWGAGPTNDTWFYDGSAWTHTASTSPPNRQAFAMTYDSARDRVVMHGGGTGSPKDDTWEFDGTEWREVPRLPQDPRPPTAKQHAIAYDPAHARVILLSVYVEVGLVYVYGTEQTEANLEVCTSGSDTDGDTKIGCADDDCWGICSPLCPPDTSCSLVDGCGDGTCDPVESCRTCPADCSVGGSSCPQQCGDFFCDGSETVASCPGDCS